ncbi:hypothetical protein HDK77DRAFT_431694 [Phyllosticta capitalensis]
MESSCALVKRPRLSYDTQTPRSLLNKANWPYFDDGDVIIQLQDEECLWTLRLHRSELEADSHQMTLLFSEGNRQGGPEGFAFHLTLGTPRTNDPIPRLTMRRRERPAVSTDISVAYRSFFAILYQQPLLLSTTDVLRAQYQAEILVHIAKRYGILEKLRPHLITHFSSFHVELFKSVAMDPPRWLNLAVDMEYEAIYKEALIHLVGMYPNHTGWAHAERTVPPALLDTIRDKGKELQQKVKDCIIRLFKIKLVRRTADNPRGDPPGTAMTLTYGSVERFILLSLHSEWLRRQLDLIEAYDNQRGPAPVPAAAAPGGRARPRPLPTAQPRGFGLLVRAIITDSEQYLPWHKVHGDLVDALYNFIAGPIVAQLEHDLRLLKTQTQGVIMHMGLNKKNLVVDEQTVRGLTYLICADVGPEDVVWRKEWRGRG